VLGRKIWSAVTRAALCAGRGTAFARRPAAARVLEKRRRAEYRLPPHSKSGLVGRQGTNGKGRGIFERMLKRMVVEAI
jgi:hypothetical protein